MRGRTPHAAGLAVAAPSVTRQAAARPTALEPGATVLFIDFGGGKSDRYRGWAVLDASDKNAVWVNPSTVAVCKFR